VIALFRAVFIVAALPSYLGLQQSIGQSSASIVSASFLGYLFALVMMLLAAAVLWANAERFGPSAGDGVAPTLPGHAVSRLAFAVLGAYIALESIDSVIRAISGFPWTFQPDSSAQFWSIVSALTQFVVGIAVYLFNRKPNLAPVTQVANWPRETGDTDAEA
jgi:hypothetical protein